MKPLKSYLESAEMTEQELAEAAGVDVVAVQDMVDLRHSGVVRLRSWLFRNAPSVLMMQDKAFRASEEPTFDHLELAELDRVAEMCEETRDNES